MDIWWEFVCEQFPLQIEKFEIVNFEWENFTFKWKPDRIVQESEIFSELKYFWLWFIQRLHQHIGIDCTTTIGISERQNLLIFHVYGDEENITSEQTEKKLIVARSLSRYKTSTTFSNSPTCQRPTYKLAQCWRILSEIKSNLSTTQNWVNKKKFLVISMLKFCFQRYFFSNRYS